MQINGDKLELLTILIEECAEVIQAATKNMKFCQIEENRKNLEMEIGDLLCMIDLAQEHGLISYSEVTDYQDAKREKLMKSSELIK